MTPQHIGRYEITRELGRGGMATVFHARDPQFDRDVAIKVLSERLLIDDTFLIRFKQEARAAAKGSPSSQSARPGPRNRLTRAPNWPI